jgi:DNA-directed RNA polymerase subunit M/transcription elongation factor TFIIS
MTITRLNPHDTMSKTSIAYAFEAGYTFTPDGDGCAEVASPTGEVYHISEWRCDCPDSMGRQGGSYELPDRRRVCKHVLFLCQLYPCSKCGASMILNTQCSWKAYTCTVCGNLKAFQAVKVERQRAYRQREQQGDVDKTVAIGEPIDNHHEATPADSFHSRYGIAIEQTGTTWTIYQAGFPICTRDTEAEAIDKAERLEVLEAQYHDKRHKSNVA